jgi:hypothetical protein
VHHRFKGRSTRGKRTWVRHDDDDDDDTTGIVTKGLKVFETIPG